MDSELASLMPNALGAGLQSDGQTTDIREYMNGFPVLGDVSQRRVSVLGERQNMIGDMCTPIHGGKPEMMRRVSMPMYTGHGGVTPQTGRAKRFCIRIKKQDIPTPAALRESQLDVEELKDALLQQAMAQRRALVSSSLRSGTGRNVKRAKFDINVNSVLKMKQTNLVSMTSTQQGMLQTQFTHGQQKELSPMEGVPERISGQQHTLTINTGWNNGHAENPSFNLSPMEGIPEFHEMAAAPPRPLETLRNASSDSPIAGVMHQSISMAPGKVADMPDMAAAMPSPVDYGDDYGDDFGGMDYGDDYGPVDDFGPMPPPALPTIAPKRRRIILNPGIRLKNELPRKSLATNKFVGRQEVAPGIRRSTRRPVEPLRWWLGEKKEFDRTSHKTMPTIATITHADPDTPWRTVDDPKGARQEKMKTKPKKTKRSRRAKNVKAQKLEMEESDLEEPEMSDEETVVIEAPKQPSVSKGRSTRKKTRVPAPKPSKTTLPVVDEAEEQVDDDITVVIRDAAAEPTVQQTAGIEDEETVVLNAQTPQSKPNPTGNPNSIEVNKKATPDTVEKKEKTTPEPVKMSGPLILEADDSVGSADNTDEMNNAPDVDFDDEIIISGKTGTPRIESKKPETPETAELREEIKEDEKVEQSGQTKSVRKSTPKRQSVKSPKAEPKVATETDAPRETMGDTSEPVTTTTGTDEKREEIDQLGIKPTTRSASKNKDVTDKKEEGKDIGKSPRRSTRTRSQKRQAE
eukprot:jgi/Picsp_1/4073/NSC_01583-R1_hypothetical protein CHLNCDRAFT_134945 [Chlorella variabilis]